MVTATNKILTDKRCSGCMRNSRLDVYFDEFMIRLSYAVIYLNLFIRCYCGLVFYL
jgi:hypothetical protein